METYRPPEIIETPSGKFALIRDKRCLMILDNRDQAENARAELEIIELLDGHYM